MPVWRCAEELKLHLRRTAPRAVRARVQPVREGRPVAKNRCTDLCPVLRLIPCVQLNPARSDGLPPARPL